MDSYFLILLFSKQFSLFSHLNFALKYCYDVVIFYLIIVFIF